MTDIQRHQLLSALADMLLEDFGEPNSQAEFYPLCHHCQAIHALRTIEALYEDLDIDNIADQIIAGRKQ